MLAVHWRQTISSLKVVSSGQSSPRQRGPKIQRRPLTLQRKRLPLFATRHPPHWKLARIFSLGNRVPVRQAPHEAFRSLFNSQLDTTTSNLLRRVSSMCSEHATTHPWALASDLMRSARSVLTRCLASLVPSRKELPSSPSSKKKKDS